jgi:hypothetical protein
LKENLQPLESSLDKVMKLRGVKYFWRKEVDGVFTDMVDGQDIGVIAQEVQEFYPELVWEDERGILNMRYGLLIPIVVDAIQEQTRHLETKEKELERLESIAKEKGLI